MPHRKVGSRSTVGSGRPTAVAAATTTTVATAAPQMALDRPSHGHNVVVAIQQPLAIIINKQFNCMIILKAAIGFAHSKIFIYEKQKLLESHMYVHMHKGGPKNTLIFFSLVTMKIAFEISIKIFSVVM